MWLIQESADGPVPNFAFDLEREELDKGDMIPAELLEQLAGLSNVEQEEKEIVKDAKPADF